MSQIMESANLQLSPEEMRLVTEPGWILTKNSIIRKTVELFAALSEEYRQMLSSPVSPKISKGENYQGLPYVMLDYPLLFGREDVLAIRTFFWWGHAFSVTLHLKGEHLQQYLPGLRRRWMQLAEAGFHVGVSDDEWRHDPENYRPIVSADDIGVASGAAPFLKLSAACGLDRWDEAYAILRDLVRVLVNVLEEV